MNIESRQMGKGYRKYNVSTLKDQFFIDDLKETSKLHVEECGGKLNGPQWEVFKGKVKNLNTVHSERL